MGIYLIYKLIDNKEILIYIGSSGQIKNGILSVRKSGLGGMKDRLVNGYHPNRFGEEKRLKRKVAFLKQMNNENINTLKFYWYVTYDNINKDVPTTIEKVLSNNYISLYKRLPDWHKQ